MKARQRSITVMSSVLVFLLLGVTPVLGLELTQAQVDRTALSYFAGADRLGPKRGPYDLRAVFADNRRLGFVVETDRVVQIPGYSGRPIGMLVGVNIDGSIAGVAIVRHGEPILGAGVSETELAQFVEQFVGRLRSGDSRGDEFDAITGATITSMVLQASIVQTLEVLPGEVAATEGREGNAAAQGASTRGATRADHRHGHVPIDEEMLVAIWRQRAVRIGILVSGLFVLTVVLVLQDWVSRYAEVARRIRLAFLLYTLIVLGWYASAQLSIINVLTFVKALVSDFRWDTFLLDPLLFILWSYVAMTILLWGRGVFCGWLCPFGALQELVSKLSIRLGVPQFAIPELIHDRLLAIKYLILLGLFGLSLHDISLAVQVSEVEPFKTAITSKFFREPGYVLYAGILVAMSAINGKFFCKYLCPLGAALTIPSHFRIFSWLRRRVECGRPCQTCAVDCPSQAIRPTGEINLNECHHCLDCQITYWNPYRCPPLVERRKRAERRGVELKLR